MIPRILHFAWIGEDGTRPDACIDSWRALNPDFELRVWGNAELSSGQWRTRSQMKELLSRDLTAVMACLRYEVLAAHGGIAVDALSIASAPIPDWLLATGAFTTWEDELESPGGLSTGLMGAAVDDDFYSHVLDDIAAIHHMIGDPRYTVGGARLAATWRATGHPLTVYPSHYLAPTYGDVSGYRGAGFVLAELLRPIIETNGRLDAQLDQDETVAREQGAAAQRLTMPTHVEGPPPLTSSFTLPPVTAPDSVVPATAQGAASKAAPSWSDLVAQIHGIEEVSEASSSSREPFRLVCATDWSSATVPFTLLTAYADILPPSAPTQLVFALPRNVVDDDALCLAVLREGMEMGRPIPPVSIESFDEVANRSCYAAVIPTGDPDELLTEMAAMIVTMHQLARTVSDPGRLAAEPVPTVGPNAPLGRRLTAFASQARG